VGELVEALARGDAAAMAAQFEEDGTARDAAGAEHAKRDGGLSRLFARLVEGGGLTLRQGGAADDGRICALEYTLVKGRGHAVEPRAGLLVLERGDSALLRSVRIYGDLEG
jgi:hypothetical protein